MILCPVKQFHHQRNHPDRRHAMKELLTDNIVPDGAGCLPLIQCMFCKEKRMTRHYCHEIVSEDIALFTTRKGLDFICGKSFCHECKIEAGYEMTNICLDCSQKKKRSSMVVFTTSEIEKMDLEALKAACKERGIQTNRLRMPGCRKRLLEWCKQKKIQK